MSPRPAHRAWHPQESISPIGQTLQPPSGKVRLPSDAGGAWSTPDEGAASIVFMFNVQKVGDG